VPASVMVTKGSPVNIVFPANPFADAENDRLTVTLLVNDGSLAGLPGNGITLGGNSKALTFKGSVADLNAYFSTAGNITYSGPQSAAAGQVLTTRVSDGGGPPVPGFARWFDASRLNLANGASVSRWPDGSINSADAYRYFPPIGSQERICPCMSLTREVGQALVRFLSQVHLHSRHWRFRAIRISVRCFPCSRAVVSC